MTDFSFFEALFGNQIDVKGSFIPGFFFIIIIYYGILFLGGFKQIRLLKKISKENQILFFMGIFLFAMIFGHISSFGTIKLLFKKWDKPNPITFFEGDNYKKNPEAKKIKLFYENYHKEQNSSDLEDSKYLFDICKEKLILSNHTYKKRLINLEAKANMYAGLMLPILLAMSFSIIYLIKHRKYLLPIALFIVLSAMLSINTWQFYLTIKYTEPHSVYTAFYYSEKGMKEKEMKRK